MKKLKKKKGLFDLKVRFIYDERLDNLKPSAFELKKLAEANEHLSRMKLPK